MSGSIMENRGWLLAVYHCFRIFGTMLKKSGTLHGSFGIFEAHDRFEIQYAY